MVLIDREIPKLNIATVVADNEKGAFKATELFIKNGMKRIGMLTISPTHLSSIKEREQGYKKALEKNGMKIDHHLIREIPFGTTTSSVIDSILAANDKGKIKVKKVEDNTSSSVEIVIHLHPEYLPMH